MSFKIGDKIVCVSCKPDGAGRFIKKGDIYTVRGFDESGFYGVLLNEARTGETYPFGGERGFMQTCFRKVDESFGKKITERIETEINQEQLQEC